MFNHLVLFSLSFALFTNCSTILFRSRGRTPISLTNEIGQTKEVEIRGSKDFFLGGFIPYRHDVFIDEEVSKAGFPTLSKLSIDDTNTLKNMVISVATLGFYCPRQYVIKGLSK